MKDTNIYVVTANSMKDEEILYWNTQQLAVSWSGWTLKLSESESYNEEEKAQETIEMLNKHVQKAIEDGYEKRLNVENFKVLAIPRKEMMIARMRGT